MLNRHVEGAPMNKDDAVMLIFGASSLLALETIKEAQQYFSVCCISRQVLEVEGCKTISVFDYSDSELRVVYEWMKSFKKAVVLFMNGVAESTAFYHLASEKISEIVSVNLTLPMSITARIIEAYPAKPISFFFVSSSRALQSDVGIAAYSASKSGLVNFAKSLSLEYGRFKKSFHVLSLGVHEGGLYYQVSEKSKKAIFERSSLKKFITGTDVFQAIRSNAFSEASTGSILKIDYGYF